MEEIKGRAMRDEADTISTRPTTAADAAVNEIVVGRLQSRDALPPGEEPCNPGSMFRGPRQIAAKARQICQTDLDRASKNLIISREASGPAGSVCDPAVLPPDQAWPLPWTVQSSRRIDPLLDLYVRRVKSLPPLDRPFWIRQASGPGLDCWSWLRNPLALEG